MPASDFALPALPAQQVEDAADAIAQLKHLQELHYEKEENATQPLPVPSDILKLAEFRRRRTSERAGAGCCMHPGPIFCRPSPASGGVQ
jgi:hypothetical protein